jgi:hypothetical protein
MLRSVTVVPSSPGETMAVSGTRFSPIRRMLVPPSSPCASVTTLHPFASYESETLAAHAAGSNPGARVSTRSSSYCWRSLSSTHGSTTEESWTETGGAGRVAVSSSAWAEASAVAPSRVVGADDREVVRPMTTATTSTMPIPSQTSVAGRSSPAHGSPFGGMTGSFRRGSSRNPSRAEAAVGSRLGSWGSRGARSSGIGPLPFSTARCYRSAIGAG